MNREIKFRAWDEKYNCWDKGGFYFYVNDPFQKQGFVIQQYTGLKDKNGKEIYEGDILQYNQNSSYDNMNFIVKWSNESLGWVFQSGSGEVLCNNNTPNGKRFNLIEVKGNIFETCPYCLGEGFVDSGGFTPWGDGINVPCSCIKDKKDLLK